MFEHRLFDSRSPLYRKPFGAVPEGESIHMRICLPRSLHCSAASLVVLGDGDGRQERFSMFWCGKEGETAEWWELDYETRGAGLYFYWFELAADGGRRVLARGNGSKGCLADRAERSWQLTVYEKDFATPDWLDGGVMYQIFPDSFCRAGEHENVPDDRIMLSWDSEPHWRPDPDGTFRNNRYYGGDLDGVISKLDYLKGLGVTCLYLNPIFESQENHRYSTADYLKIDPMLGDENTFRTLCAEAGKRGMRVILDGVFSHTGCDSVYFNKYRRYDSNGAYNSPDSPYRSWYSFEHWPDKYASWWGFENLPELIEENDGVMQFINGSGGVAQKWLAQGAGGWRLDVADELPDGFLDGLRAAVKAEKPDAVIIGEVWEDASNKCAYSRRRRYLLGKQLDSVMNYCFRDAILTFLVGGDGAAAMEKILSVVENYPPQVTRLLMNMLGTHDTERILTALGGEPSGDRGRDWQAGRRLDDGQRDIGRRRYKLAALLQYTLPGVPSVYYGDERGMEGYRDPFNRESMKWDREDAELAAMHTALAKLRKENDCFRGAEMREVFAEGRLLAYERTGETTRLLVAINADAVRRELALPEHYKNSDEIFGEGATITDGKLFLEPNTAAVLRRAEEKPTEKKTAHRRK